MVGRRCGGAGFAAPAVGSSRVDGHLAVVDSVDGHGAAAGPSMVGGADHRCDAQYHSPIVGVDSGSLT